MIPTAPSGFSPHRILFKRGDSPSASSFRKQADKKIPTQESPTVNKSVTFSRRVKAKKIRSYNFFSQEELDSVWYSPNEYTEIKQRCIETLKKIQQDPGFADCSEFSSRGLEIRTKNASQTRKQNKSFAMKAVLDEQRLQDSENIKDPERIRNAYREISIVSQGVASFMGARDREVVGAFR